MKEERLPAKSFRDLIVWRKAHEFVLAAYGYTEAMPKQETYGLCIQMRRAAVSIAANIAEGFRKRGRADKVRYMNTAEGSLEESRYYLILAQDLGYGITDKLTSLLEEVSRLLDAYSKAIISAPLQEMSHEKGSWIFRTVGYGHDADFWCDMVSTLQMVGYDHVLSIEHEDSLMSVEEGLTKAASFLNQIVIKEKLKGMWWA